MDLKHQRKQKTFSLSPLYWENLKMCFNTHTLHTHSIFTIEKQIHRYIDILPAWMSVHHMLVWFLVSDPLELDIDSCELHFGCWESNSCVLEEQKCFDSWAITPAPTKIPLLSLHLASHKTGVLCFVAHFLALL